jgi:hypothetical protein
MNDAETKQACLEAWEATLRNLLGYDEANVASTVEEIRQRVRLDEADSWACHDDPYAAVVSYLVPDEVEATCDDTRLSYLYKDLRILLAGVNRNSTASWRRAREQRNKLLQDYVAPKPSLAGAVSTT